MGIDKSNPFDRDPSDEMVYGPGGRDIPIRPAEPGVDSGESGTVAKGVHSANFEPFEEGVDS